MRGSSIEFFKNGVGQGVAYQDLSAPIAAAFLVHPKRRKPKEVHSSTV